MQSACKDLTTSCAAISGRKPCRCSVLHLQRSRRWRRAPFSSPDARSRRVTCAVSSGPDQVLRRCHKPAAAVVPHAHRVRVGPLSVSSAAAEEVLNHVLLPRSMSSSEECSVLVVDGQRLVQEVPRFRLLISSAPVDNAVDAHHVHACHRRVRDTIPPQPLARHWGGHCWEHFC